MKNVLPKSNAVPCLLVSDHVGAAYVCAALTAVGIHEPTVIQPKRGWRKAVSRTFEARRGILVLVPTDRFNEEAVLSASEVSALGSNTVVWSRDRVASKGDVDDNWLAERLLLQRGALLTPELSVLAALVGILSQPDFRTISRVRIQGRRSSVTDRLKTYLSDHGVLSTRQKESFVVNVTDHGVISCGSDSGEGSLGDPFSIAAAVSMISAHQSICPEDTAVVPKSNDELSLILSPPRRLLSEIVSKRILSAHDMRLPKEQLCKSPSEAARYAASLGGPVVMKLVKPNLEEKQRLGAVIRDVKGGASVRRAAQTLEGIGVSLGPPRSLGVLVSEQILGDASLWMSMTDHPRFGRLLLGGVGERKGRSISFALKTPASAIEASRALLCSGDFPAEHAILPLSKGVARFSQILEHLGDRIDRAEIHPMVSRAQDKEPIVLDALISIAEKQRK